MTVSPGLLYGREVYYNSMGTNVGPTGVAGGNGDPFFNIGVVTFRPVRHWIDLTFVARGNTAGSVLQMMLFDQTAGSPGTQLCLPWWHAPPVASIAQLVRCQAVFFPTAGQRSMMLRWASNGGSWEILNGSFLNGTIVIREAPAERGSLAAGAT